MSAASQSAVGGTGQDTPSSEIDNTASSPCLRNAATAAPREDFYDHFLDGAAGVMYTSFLGLILDDLIAVGTGKYKKC